MEEMETYKKAEEKKAKNPYSNLEQVIVYAPSIFLLPNLLPQHLVTE
jgi:hypothetical protein